ncbi:MAG: DUF4132 domain-containing protein [Proteobacteria bacterium]|nr:DUF4132 domain-containing protein [Pseudomonadota bacterium]
MGFDEGLAPFVKNPDGTRRKALPKLSSKDDPAKAAAALASWKGLRADAKSQAKSVLYRLDRAMGGGRRWALADWRRDLADHRLVGHLVRRLVWLADNGAFCLAEDGTLADVDDERFTPQSPTRLAHPIDLDLSGWREVFDDYEIIQPIAQLERPVFTPTADELGATELARVACAPRPEDPGAPGAGLGAGRRRGRGGLGRLDGEAGRGITAYLNLAEEVGLGWVNEYPSVACTLTLGRPTARKPGLPQTFGELSARDFSELVLDVTSLT